MTEELNIFFFFNENHENVQILNKFHWNMFLDSNFMASRQYGSGNGLVQSDNGEPMMTKTTMPQSHKELILKRYKEMKQNWDLGSSFCFMEPWFR